MGFIGSRIPETGKENAAYNSYPYPDVKAGSYYEPYVKLARAYGILADSDGNRFRPDEPVLREDAFVWIARVITPEQAYEDDLKAFEAAFADTADIAKGEAYDSISALYTRGFVRGSDGKINPKANMTRAEGAQVLFNIL